MSQPQTTAIHRCSRAILISVVVWIGAGSVSAQETPQPSWKQNFDDVTVEVIRPEDLPKAEESILPAALSRKGALPRPTSLETLRESSAAISDRVIEVIVVPRNNSPVRQSTIIVRGEAVWLSAKAGAVDPVLVTNAHYLLDAEAVFVKAAPKRKSGALPTAQRRSIQEMNLGADVKALLADPALVPAKVTNVDKHRNLATLELPDNRMPAPAAGLVFFPIDDQAIATPYGFSHQMGSTLVATAFLAPSSKRDELEFYLHSSFPVILGAPIVADDGRVIAITAARHPTELDRTLVVPPRALRRFVAKVQGIDVSADAKK